MAKPKQAGARPRRERLVKVDATLKRTYDELVSQLRSHKREGASAFDALWETVGAIVEHEPPLYVVGGYKNDTEFFAGELGEKRRNAYRYIRVAKYASPNEEEKYTVTKLDAALGFIEAKLGHPLAHPPLPIAFDRLKIPVEHEGKPRKLPLVDAHVEDVLAATRALTRSSKKPRNSNESVLRTVLAADPAFKDVRLHVRKGTVSFTGVPLAALGNFATLVAKAPPRLRNTVEKAGTMKAKTSARRGRGSALR